MFLLKVVASFLESDYFLLAMLDKFDLVDWARYVQLLSFYRQRNAKKNEHI